MEFFETTVVGWSKDKTGSLIKFFETSVVGWKKYTYVSTTIVLPLPVSTTIVLPLPSFLQELFIAKLAQESHRVAEEASKGEVVYKHLCKLLRERWCTSTYVSF